MQNQFREREVVINHVAAIGAGGVGACPLMKDCFDSIGQRFALDGANELVGLHEVGEPQITEVAEVIAAAIDYEDVGDALGVQRAEQVAADESCTAGYYDHCFTASQSRIESRIIVAADRGADHYRRVGYSSHGQ